jgi:spore cortex biosynthesis protein YabQ
MNGAVDEAIFLEGRLFLLSLGLGVLLMLLYDLLRIFRQVVRHNTLLLALEDALYWLGCAIGIFAMLYQRNDGLLRWFVPAGAAVGMLWENHFISPPLVRAAVKIVRRIARIASRISGVFLGPIRKFRRFCKKELKKIAKAIKMGIYKQ